MKHTTKSIIVALLSLVLLLTMPSCKLGSTEQPETNTQAINNLPIQAKGLWANALYLDNTSFGEGEKTIAVEVSAEKQTVTFTIHTDKTTVGEALLEHQLIEGEAGAYGMYIKKVNGITADYDVDQSYWAFYVNGEYAMAGVDTTEITDGATYRLEYAK